MKPPVNPGLSRRSLLIGGAAAGTSALSYGRIAGANDRIRLGQVGVGSRGRELASVVAELKDSHNVDMAAVCDLWTVNRERAATAAGHAYGRAPRSFTYLEDMLALQDVDAVIISTADFQHAPMLKLAAEAGKDAYCEKPMANVLEEAKAARDAVRRSGLVVQVGTQHRSEPYQIAAKEWISSGALGHVSKVEIVWNYHGPRWRGRPEVNQIREEDTDWRRWLLHKPYRPFDPRLYFEFRLYREFSSGIADQWMSHGIDLVHYLLDESFPKSVVAHGGIFAWHDGRENPDTFQALLEYPKGFLVSYSTSFGNDSDSGTRIMGDKATLINVGGEGSQRWKLVEEKGTHEANPFVHRSHKYVKLTGENLHALPWAQRLVTGAVEKTYGPLPFTLDSNPSHMKNWLECLRSRQQPNATVEHGFAHSVAVIMAARAQQEGRKLWWDAANEEILEHAPPT
ncbi:MAG TPA: Gfo/Idh/MocA family oxidoreductase [Candidatus Acidoferrales bacterium]|jgi:predicted dehydrogenase|nr:Gfo/Idh/MocA family oxidoreductase [Candidatus Acidoferrales bacterium]